MQKITMTRGLPASGKTTWSKDFVKKHNNWKRVSKDDLREMLDCSVFSRANEKMIIDLRNQIILKSITRKL